MVVTNDDARAAQLQSLHAMANHPTRRYFHTGIGYNYRMTDMQAAIGIGQLHSLQKNLLKRRRITDYYYGYLRRHVSVPKATVAEGYSPWLFTFELPEGCPRDLIMTELAKAGIETRPTFVPMQEVFERYHGKFPISERVSKRGMSLPTYPGLTLDDANFICSELLKWI